MAFDQPLPITDRDTMKIVGGHVNNGSHRRLKILSVMRQLRSPSSCILE